MKIALVGYGKMGKEIDKVAKERGHEVVARIDPTTGEDFSSPNLARADVVIEFTTPESAFGNYMECFKLGLPVVSGTTGWLKRMDEVKERCSNKAQTFFYASNFSVGVNLFMELNNHLARLMDNMPGYEVSLTEVHHTQKADAPGGTAISLAEGIIRNISRKTKWELNGESSPDTIEIKAFREGNVTGMHTVKYESEVDEIIIHHNAKSRRGFALGAVLAAEFTSTSKGFLTMSDLLKF